ncbi:MAG: DUF4988 domain-containing protein [Muribaculum sp.]|nr:DUF4988 domain-containing protein [Muribaculum sp.]
MKKKFANMLLCGAVIATSGMLSSCEDNDDYDTRISVLETAISDLKTQIDKALTVGASVTNVTEDNGTYVITLSDGQVITIKPGTQSGGTEVSVTLTDTEAIIKVGDTEYKLPLGSAVNSLIYSPEFSDGEVQINDTKGAVVKFLVRPAIDNIDGAEFTIAESHELKSRAMGEVDFKVSSAELKDGFINLNVVCLNGELAGTKHAASIQMKYRGAVIGSNYFTINVGSGFSFSSEEIDSNIKAIGGSLCEDGITWNLPAEGAEILGEMDLASHFEGIPSGAEFRIAPKDKQPGGKAQEKYEILTSSLAKDGKFKFSARPATNFNDNAERKGFLVYIVKNEVTIAKTYIVINDRLAEAKESLYLAITKNCHMEYGEPKEDRTEGTGLYLNPGVNEISIPDIIFNGKLSLGHGDSWKVVDYLAAGTYSNDYIYCTGSGFALTDEAKKYCSRSVGISWASTQNSLASSNRRNWSLSGEELQAAANGKCDGEIIGGWDGSFQLEEIGASVGHDGILKTDATFKGYCMRLGIEVRLIYDFGTLQLVNGGKIAFMWFGRRTLAEGVVDPDAR